MFACKKVNSKCNAMQCNALQSHTTCVLYSESGKNMHFLSEKDTNTDSTELKSHEMFNTKHCSENIVHS